MVLCTSTLPFFRFLICIYIHIRAHIGFLSLWQSTSIPSKHRYLEAEGPIMIHNCSSIFIHTFYFDVSTTFNSLSSAGCCELRNVHFSFRKEILGSDVHLVGMLHAFNVAPNLLPFICMCIDGIFI